MRHTQITSRNAARRATLFATCCCIAAVVLSIVAAHASAASAPRRVGSFAPHLGRSIVSTSGDYLGPQIATWYGPGFWGHHLACGGTLHQDTFGIAHRTLPCGSLVTIANGHRKITVRVIDRGPYSGASVDLTARTKSYLHFTSGTVRMARVDSYRLLAPRPRR